MAKMYAAKFRLHSIRKVFKRSGVYLSNPIGNTGYGAIDSQIMSWAGKEGQNVDIPEIPYAYYKDISKPDRRFKVVSQSDVENSVKLYTRGTTMFSLPCVICGTYDDIEMHHVDHLSKITGN